MMRHERAATNGNGGRRWPTNVAEVMRTAFVSVEEGTPLRNVIATMDRDDIDELPVAGRTGTLQGMVRRRAVERCLFDTETGARATAGAVVEPPVAHATRQERVEAAARTCCRATPTSCRSCRPAVGSKACSCSTTSGRCRILVDTVIVTRREQAAVAAIAEAKVNTACAVGSAFLGVVLFALWVNGPW